jgi:hypothetical protein
MGPELSLYYWAELGIGIPMTNISIQEKKQQESQ